MELEDEGDGQHADGELSLRKVKRLLEKPKLTETKSRLACPAFYCFS